MVAARFVSGMIGTLAVFGTATYCLTGSFTAVLVQAGLCVLFMQVAYSLAALFLVWKQGLGMVSAYDPDMLLGQQDTSLSGPYSFAPSELHAESHLGGGRQSPSAELTNDNVITPVEPEDSHSIMTPAASTSI
ncbi:hypothetical protein GCM10007880_65290 [Mesorhizobium amorphae]|uniref:exopolysaccharide production repressor protein n=1 Tax=Mesorhizobium amorphae TaxID=71433 RepID=UPI00235CB942|nr:exopolysaccharide production repressor protein [Mesorhizobium amorphae]GLR46011.1 hypothetical protein GCM10007880_65290 [Mesorhizobium amorphae]